MFNKYIKAARIRTLPLSVSGILLGAFLANNSFNIFTNPIFWLAILTTICFQILSNFANDYGDGIKGSDNNRKGEKRMVASGLITPKQMKKAILIMILLTLFFFILLIYISFGYNNFAFSLIFFFLGILSIFAAIKYTVGKSAYGYSGYGDIFVFVFFGILAVVGTFFLFTQKITFNIFLPAITLGLLSTSVLNLNNMRDIENDKKVGKNTIVVIIGTKKAKIYHFFLIFISLITALLYVFINYKSFLQFIFLITYIPLFYNVFYVYKNKEKFKLDSQLKIVALSTFVFSIVFGIVNIL